MSLLPSNKATDSPKKNLYENVKEADKEKSLEEIDLLENSSRLTGGAGETPVKKPVKKSTKAEDEKTGKKITPAVIDKIPKKNAQRTRGSIALNKTVAEKSNAEGAEKKRPGCEVNEISQAKDGGYVDNPKGGTDGRRSPVSVPNKESKTKAGSKKAGKKDPKSVKSQKPWMDAVEKLSNEVLKTEGTMSKKESTDMTEMQCADMQPLNPPFATCSFFEKLQQGVKSYFSSKNSFTPYDKVKKEGGNQTRARVAKGVKEDTKKRDPGLIVKNDIYSSESDSFHDELRLNSNLGGQSNNFSSNKPKIFRMLKRKKLYHPKKHYVRIQIPRKGYFYRSTVQLKAPGSTSTSSGQFERMEPQGVPKRESKVQISGLASTSAKVSNLPNKKRVKRRQSNPEEDCNPKKDCISPEHSERLTFHDKKPGYTFQKMVSNYLLLHWPKENSNFQEEKKLQSEDDLVLELVNYELEGEGQEGQMSAISENLYNPISWKTVKSSNEKTFRSGDDSYNNFDEINDSVRPAKKKQKKTSETTFETLINCINSTLGNDKLGHDLEISPIKTITQDEKEMPYEPATLRSFPNAPLDFTDIMKVFNNFDFDVDCENLVESEDLYVSSISTTNFDPSESEVSAALIKEIDLHVELRNYLKEYETMDKSNTKSGQEDFENDVDVKYDINEFSKVRDCKSHSSFRSASSIHLQEEESTSQLRMFLDCKRDMMSVSEECIRTRPTEVYNVQNEFSDELDEIKKIRSESERIKLPHEAMPKSSIKRTFGKTSFHTIHLEDKENSVSRGQSSMGKDFSTEDSTDSYEKITPFVTNSNKSNDSKAKNLSRVLFENAVYSQSADSVSQPVQKVSSHGHQLDIGTCDQFIAVEPVPPALEKESVGNERVSTSFKPGPSSSKWSPTLKDLIDIYNNVLKQNKNARQKKKNSINDSFSSHLIAFLNEKLKEKQFKADLLELSKEFSKSCKPPSNWKPIKPKRDSVNVKEYVSIFQEILQSSLSITQIARLNNIISDLQNCSEKNYELFKDLKNTADAETETETEKKTKKNSSPDVKTEILSKKASSKRETKSFFSSKAKLEFPVEISENSSKISKASREYSGVELKSKSLKSEKTKGKMCDNELDFMLKTCFDSVEVLRNDSVVTPANNKVLVTVKMSGNRILVNGLSYINGEDSLFSQETKSDDTTELIIESVTKDQLRDAWYDTKCRKLKLKRSQAKETSKKSDLKPSKLKASKSRKLPRRPVKTKPKGGFSGGFSDSETEEDRSTQVPLSQEQCKPSKLSFPFEYNQMQLRAQHPIEAIIESSESKVSEIFENSENEKSKPKPELPAAKKLVFRDVLKNPNATKVALKEALGESVFSKDLAQNIDWSQEEIGDALGRTKSSVIRRQTLKGRPTKKKILADSVRSMVELNTRPCIKRKGRKVPPARLRETYFCFPSTFSLQDKSLKSSPKSKEKFKDKKPINRYAFHKTTAKSIAPHNTKQEIPKKIFQDHESSEQKSETTTASAQTLDPKPESPTTTEQNLETPSSKRGSIQDGKLKPECCSIEVLLSEKIKNALPLSISGFLERQGLRTLSQQYPTPVQREAPNPKQASEVSMKNVCESPITLHPAKSSLDDISFPAMIIHSDSFLKCFPSLALTKSKLQSLFKSSSDMKFYPGKINKNGSEGKSFVTFMLTPEQKEAAGLPSNKIQVVTKPLVAKTAAAADADGAVGNEGAAAEEKLYKIDETKSLGSIEKFIDQYSKCRKRTAKLKQAQETKKNEQKKPTERPSVLNRKMKSVGPPLPALEFPPEKKLYHECQRRRKALAKMDMKGRKGMKASDKREAAQIKKTKIIEKKDKSEKVHLFFPNKIKDFIKVLENFEEKAREGREDTLKSEETNKNKHTEMNSQKGSKTSEDADETKPSKNLTNIFPKVLETIKTALGQVDDFKSKSEIISVIEKELEKKKPQLCEEALIASDNLEVLPPAKKLKSVKIKIHCADQNYSKERQEAEKFVPSYPAEKVLLREETTFVQVPHPCTHQMGEIELLNSLVSGEANGGDLERKNSMYFDALEKTWPDEIGGAGEELRNSQRTFQKPREGALDLNAEFDVKEESKSSFHPLLTPSDEKLFFSDASEEIVMNKIAKSLKQDKIAYSMALLDEFLKQIENSSDHESKCSKLRRMLWLVENKSRNLMMNMEKRAWLKVLSLLEEVSQIFESEGIKDSMRGHLEITKTFIDRIQELNMSRLSDFQNFCCTLSQQSPTKSEESNIRNIFGRICDSLNSLKQKFILRRGSSHKEVEKPVNYEMRHQDTESNFKFHSTLSLPDINGNVDQHNEKSQVEYLKKKIQDQKACIEQMLKPDMDFTPQEISQVKNKVAKKMKWLEKMFGFYIKDKATEARPSRKSDARLSKDKSVPKNFGYSDMMQYLIKAWDTRMPLSTFSGESFN